MELLETGGRGAGSLRAARWRNGRVPEPDTGKDLKDFKDTKDNKDGLPCP